MGIFWLARYITTDFGRYVKDDGVDDGGLGHDTTIDLFFAAHHLEANLVYEVGIVLSEVLIDLVAEPVKLDIVLEVGQDARLLLVLHRVDLQSDRQGRRRMHSLRERRQYQIFELDGVVRQGINEIKVEVAQELRIVFQNDKYNVNRSSVETAHCCGRLLASNEVALDESETAHQEVFHFVKALQLALDFLPVSLFMWRWLTARLHLVLLIGGLFQFLLEHLVIVLSES